MKRLNLANSSKSQINYKVLSYPDGQCDIIIEDWTRTYKDDNIVIIEARINNLEQLGLVICANAALRNLGIEEVHLYAPYILGGRSDRQFIIGGTSYLRDVVAPLINLQNFKSVTTLDPHSDVMEAVIHRLKKKSNLELVKWATRNICGVISEKGPNSKYPFVLLSPDAGASKKIYKIANEIGYTEDVITCGKDRDENGKLTKCVIPMQIEVYNGMDFVIIDDICDGGATFINIAKELKKLYPDGKIYLIVSHGIFSKGLLELAKYFTGIYTTNSYGPIRVEDAKDVRCARIINQLEII